jgi:hypothetical protein
MQILMMVKAEYRTAKTAVLGQEPAARVNGGRSAVLRLSQRVKPRRKKWIYGFNRSGQ